MKINEVTAPLKEMSPQERQIAELGRTLMDMAATHKDDAESNQMASLGSAMTEFGSLFGPKNLPELVKRSRVEPKDIQRYLKMAQERLKSAGPVRKGVEKPEPEDNDDF